MRKTAHRIFPENTPRPSDEKLSELVRSAYEASTTLERSAGTGSHGAKPTRERRRSCATTSRRRRAGCARLRASSAASRGPRRRVHALKRHVQLRWWWWWVVGDKSAKFSQQASQNLGKYILSPTVSDLSRVASA